MRGTRVFCCILVLGVLAACSNPHEKAAKAQQHSYEAQEQVARERLALVEKYQVCVGEAASDVAKIEACDTYLKAAEALK